LPEFIDRWGQFDNLCGTYFFFAIVYGAISIALTIKSKGLLDRWRIATLTAASFLCGLIFYFYLPLASMTNPPVNWGYPRTLEGFAHVLGRGQYERIGEYINDDHFSYFKVAGTYFLATVSAIGLIYLIPTILSFFWLFKTRGRSRRWMLALVSCFCALFLLPIVVVDPLADARPSAQMMSFLLPSHLILMIWSGYGLVYLGTVISRKRDPGKHSLC
jgi:hypothetical protein